MQLRFPIMFLLAGSIVIMGCGSRSIAENERFQRLFQGYELVLIDGLPKDASVDSLKNVERSALRSTYLLEAKMVPGRIYVFRKTNQLENETLAMKVIPKRLIDIGADDIKTPKSSKDFAYLFIGGPLFSIEFKYRGHSGMIANRVYTSEKASENREELIFVYI